jgi:anti-sigma regulatory factor (Ser/Thr protein kinase)
VTAPLPRTPVVHREVVPGRSHAADTWRIRWTKPAAGHPLRVEPVAVAFYRSRFDLAALTSVRRAVAAWLARTDMSRDQAGDVTLAVAEMLGNAIKHGGGGGTVQLSLIDRCVRCVISDDGPGLPEQVDRRHAPRPGPGAVGGRGLWLAFTLCTAVILSSSAQGTRVELIVDVPPPD